MQLVNLICWHLIIIRVIKLSMNVIMIYDLILLYELSIWKLLFPHIKCYSINFIK